MKKGIQISITFTLLTLYDMIDAFIKGNESLQYFDLLTRFVLITIAFLSLLIFNYLKEWPLRIVQLFHYILTLCFISLYLLIVNIITNLSRDYFFNIFISYTVTYFIILLIYEVYYRYNIRKHNILLKKMKNKE